MKEKKNASPILLAVAGVVVLSVMWALCPCSCAVSGKLARRTQCQSNLHQIDLALSAHCYPPVSNYPPNLAMLSTDDVCPKIFVCPATDHEPGSLTNVMEWMDYIYVAGLNPSTPAGMSVLICPPMHHDKDGACVLDADHAVRWIPTAEFGDLMRNLYTVAGSNNLTIVVSRTLQERSGGRYKSYP